MKNKILLLAMLFFLFSGCDFSIWEIKNKDEKKPIQKKNNIAELKPKHRFAMPLEDVGNEKKFKETVKNILKYELYDIAEVTEEIFKKFPNPSEDKDFKLDYKMIMRDFPNLSKEELKANDSLIARYYAVNLDYEVLQILKKTKTPKKEKKRRKIKIKLDFPKSYSYYGYGNPPASMPCSAISFPTDRNKFLMNYYLPCQTQNSQGNINVVSVMGGSSQSIPCKCVEEEYQKLQPIWADQAKKQQKRAMNDCTPKRDGSDSNKWGTWFQMNFTSQHAIASWLGVSQVVVSFAIDRAAHYANADYIKYDAVKHMYWQMLLCKFYYPIFQAGSKLFRMDFAKEVGEWYEVLGDNNMDDSEMDLHNNAVGRQLWADRSWYSGWWIFTVVRSPSRSTLLDEARDKYHGWHKYAREGGRQIVHEEIIKLKRNNIKTKLGNTYDYNAEVYKNGNNKGKPKNDKTKFESKLNICNRRYWILNNANANIPVEIFRNQPNKK